jgi:hypothetical protein
MRCEPAHSIVKAAGGVNAVAEACGVSRWAVWKWTRPQKLVADGGKEKNVGGSGGAIPVKHWHDIIVLAARHGRALSADDFLARRRKENAA